jgi:hypothetical protein
MECASQQELFLGTGVPAEECAGRFFSLGDRDCFEGGDEPICEYTFVQSQQWKVRLNFMRCKAGAVKPQDIFQIMVEIVHRQFQILNVLCSVSPAL